MSPPLPGVGLSAPENRFADLAAEPCPWGRPRAFGSRSPPPGSFPARFRVIPGASTPHLSSPPQRPPDPGRSGGPAACAARTTWANTSSVS